MALIQLGGGVSEIRGSIAGTTYARNKSGAYARNRTKPVNPNTVSQSANRARFAGQSAAWNALTQVQRDGWNFLASGSTRLNRLGQSYTPTGRQLFLEAANNMALAGLSIIEDAPINADIPASPVYTGMTIETDAGPPRAWTGILLTGGVATSFKQIIKATPPNPGPKTNFTNLYRVIGTANESASNNITTYYSGTFGTVPGLTGSPISFLISNLDTATGFRSAELRMDGVVPVDTP